MLLCTEVNRGIFSSKSTQLNQAALSKSKLFLHVAQNLLKTKVKRFCDSLPGSMLWEWRWKGDMGRLLLGGCRRTGESAEQMVLQKCRNKKVTAWNSKCCINVVRSEAKMSRPTLRPAGTLWALAKMLKESGPFTWRQALSQQYYFLYSSQNWCKIHTNVLVFGLRM